MTEILTAWRIFILHAKGIFQGVQMAAPVFNENYDVQNCQLHQQ